MTKGIILSGGWGTRLRPLTCSTPKTLMPVVNKPVIERQMMLLKEAGVKEVVLAVSVLSDALKNYFKDGEKLGLRIYYTDEKHPLGTAGAIKLAESYLNDDNFFMINGDVIFHFDFKTMLNSHEKLGGLGTIGSRIVEDPIRYGVLIVDETQKILKFLEKNEYNPPSEDKYKPMPVNAGVYILEPEVFSYIDAKKYVSIELDIFPKLASERKLYHYPISGIWKDIGQPLELLEGNILLMKDILNNLNQPKDNIIDASAKMEGRILIYPPVTIGKNTVVRNNCIIGPNVVIGDNVYIDEHSEIKESLIYNDVYISKNVKIEKSIIADNCLIRDDVVLKGNEKKLVILASFVEVLKRIRMIAPTTIDLTACHHEVVKESRS